jgi:hypothetical protein
MKDSKQSSAEFISVSGLSEAKEERINADLRLAAIFRDMLDCLAAGGHR